MQEVFNPTWLLNALFSQVLKMKTAQPLWATVPVLDCLYDESVFPSFGQKLSSLNFCLFSPAMHCCKEPSSILGACLGQLEKKTLVFLAEQEPRHALLNRN